MGEPLWSPKKTGNQFPSNIYKSMDPEEPISQDGEQQPGGDTSSNTYPGQWSNDKAQKLYNLSQTPKKIRNLEKGMKNAGKIAKNAGKMARSGVQAARAAYAAAQATYATVSTIASLISVKVIIIILIIFLIIVMFKIFTGDNSSNLSNTQLESSGPIFAKIGDRLDYTITINYHGTAGNIIITDQIPNGTKYVNAPQATYDPVSNTVTWNIAAITASALNNINTTLSLTLLATKDNDYIINVLKGKMLGEVRYNLVPDEVLGESVSQVFDKSITPTIFQIAPANTPVSPQDANIIKTCVVTKVGEPVTIPPLPPECTDF